MRGPFLAGILDKIDAGFHPETQMTTGQIFAIAAAISAMGPKPNVLVFGLGNDSPLWHSLNEGGYTRFVEDNAKWLKMQKERFPYLNIEQISYGDRTVATSLPLKTEELDRYPVPQCLLGKQWDVIVVDSPMGHQSHRPGRSLSIYWTWKIAGPQCQVFVDDYNRPLERTYADYFFRSRRPWNVEIPRLVRKGEKSGGMLLWSMGLPSRPVNALLDWQGTD